MTKDILESLYSMSRSGQ